jgi:hypothetical protein
MLKMMPRFVGALIGALLLFSGAASAQSSPGWSYGFVPTPGQWNAEFASKADYPGAPLCGTNGCTMTGPLITAPSIAGAAGFNVPVGVAPSAPNNGDIWTTAAGIFVQIAGATVGPLASTSGPDVFTGQITTQGLTTTQPGWFAQITGDTVARTRIGPNSVDVPAISFGPGNAARDTHLERAAPATWRFGSADAAAPIAQTLIVQNVVAGTSNTAGTNLIIDGSQGTGTGAGGSIVFQVAPAGSTGTAQNALSPALTLNSAKLATFGGHVLIEGVTSTGATGTGNLVFSTSPTLVTPALGTPSSVNLSNATGLPIGTGVSGLGTGVATFLATPSSANMAAMLTTSTGTGLNVFGTSPALLGSPTAPTQALGDTSTDIATDAFVANAINAQVDMKDPVQAATTAALIFSPTYSNGSSGVGATLTATTVGVLILDGYTPVLGDRLLIKNQASTFQNGCYTVTTLGVVVTTDYVLTRCIDYNQTTEIVYGTTFPVLQGATNANQQFTMNNNAAITVGTTAITYAQTSGGSQLQAGTGIAITGNTVSATLGTNSAPGILQCDGSTTTCTGGSITAVGSAPIGLVATQPQGRLTLTSGVAITTTDVTGATQSIYTPAPGYYLPITVDGINFTMTQFEEYAQNTTDTVKSPAAVGANGVYDMFAWLDSTTATMTIASPAVMSWTANGFAANNAFSCTTTGTFATGFVSGQTYYVISASLGANSFEFSTTAGGSAVNTTGSQSGTITCKTVRVTRGPSWPSDTARGGSSVINYATLWPTNAVSITNGPTANKGVKVGSIRANASSQLVDSKSFRWVSNAYQCVPRRMQVVEPASSWSYTTSTFRQANGNAADQLDFLQTEAGNILTAHVNASYSNTNAGTFGQSAIGINTVNGTSIVDATNSLAGVQTANGTTPSTADYVDAPGLGRNIAIWEEWSSATGTGTFSGTAGGLIVQSGISGSICN